MKALNLLKKYREIFMDVTMDELDEFDDIGVNFISQLNDAITELEELESRNCDGCLHRSELHEELINGTTNGFCVENGFFTKRGFCCNRYEQKEQ